MFNQFDHIEYNDDLHAYRSNGKLLRSVTQVISQKIKPPFDAEKISMMVAKKENRPVADVLAEWHAKGEKGRTQGSHTHNYIENKLNNTPYDESLITPECTSFDAFWRGITSKSQIKCLRQEWPIGDIDWGIAGKLDTILQISNGSISNNYIFDWKTGKFETEDGYNQLLKPFNDMSDCQLNVYSIQLSLYRLFLDKHTDLKIAGCFLVHLRQDGTFTVHKALDLRDRLKSWLDTDGHLFLDEAKSQYYINMINSIENNLGKDAKALSLEALDRLASLPRIISNKMQQEIDARIWAGS